MAPWNPLVNQAPSSFGFANPSAVWSSTDWTDRLGPKLRKVPRDPLMTVRSS